MPSLDDYPIEPERDSFSSPVSPSGSTWRVWGVAAVCVIIAGALIAFFVVRPSKEAIGKPTPASTSSPEASTPRGPLGPEIEARELPPLDLSDPAVRELLSGLSSRPELAAWLATDGLVRSIAASVDDVANGTAPSSHLQKLAPTSKFTVASRGATYVIDSRSYQRYDGIADTVASIDANGVARAYVTLRPRLQEAYRELGYPDGNIDSAVERAISRLLITQVIPEGASVHPGPVLYKYSDERIESLTPAQKQLLRMGPRNMRIVQDKLREVARALGINASATTARP